MYLFMGIALYVIAQEMLPQLSTVEQAGGAVIVVALIAILKGRSSEQPQ